MNLFSIVLFFFDLCTAAFRFAAPGLRLFAAAVILIVVVNGGCGGRNAGFLTADEKKWLDENREELVFAPDPAYAPFEFFDAEENMTRGLAYDFIKLIENKLGVEFKTVKADTFSEVLALVKDKKVSIVNAVTPTPERSEFLSFTDHYIEIENVIIVQKKIKGVIRFESLRNKKISVIKGYAVTEYLLKKYPSFNYDFVNNDLQALQNVAYSQSDAAVLDIASSSYFIDITGIANLRIGGNTGYPIRLSIGSRKDLPQLNRILNKALAAITENERKVIKKKWIGFSGTDFFYSRTFRIAALSILGFFILSVSAIFIWNRMLKRQVSERTIELSDALKKKQQIEDEIRNANRALEARSREFERMNEELLTANRELCENESMLSKFLNEKDVLIRELYHRTKNTIQVVRGMLLLQADKFPGNEGVRRLVDDTEMRINTISLVHEMLYKSNDLSRISIKEYINELTGLILRNYAGSKMNISLDLKIDESNVVLDIAIPLGLILNELMMNSLKHAFPGGREGTISLMLTGDGKGNKKFYYSDNGAGVPADFNFKERDSFGLQLIFGIAEQQLQGTVRFSAEAGVSFSMIFSDSIYKVRV